MKPLAPIIVGAPVWIEREWARGKIDRERVCWVGGLIDQAGYGDGVHSVPIDASIAHIVAELNWRGYPTLFCCSGLPEDHLYVEGMPCLNPYILFADLEWDALPHSLAPAGTVITWNGKHWAFNSDFEVARRQWRELATTLGVEFDMGETPYGAASRDPVG